MHDLRDCLLALITISGAGAAAALAAGSSLPYGEGGYVPNLVKIVRQYNMSGDEFRIEGVCKSACTMFLGIPDVCVERDARLMFHAGHDIAENRTGPDTRASRAALYRNNRSLPFRGACECPGLGPLLVVRVHSGFGLVSGATTIRVRGSPVVRFRR